MEREWEGFFLRIARAGDYLYEGADLGSLIPPGRLMNERGELNSRAKAWAGGLRGRFRSRPVGPSKLEEAPQAGSFKIY